MEYRIDREESRRLSALKFWLCVLVVMIHAYSAGINLGDTRVVMQVSGAPRVMMFLISRVISDCAVPGFFLISGVLLFRREFTWAGNVRKKLRTLLVPYLLLNTFWIGFYFLFQHIPPLRAFFTNEARDISRWGLREWTNAYLGWDPAGGWGNCPFLTPLWFMRDLMLLNLVAPALAWLMRRLPRLCLAALAALLLLNAPPPLPFMDRGALIYFCLGWYVVRSGLHIGDVDRIPAPALLIAYPLSVALGFVTYNMRLHYLASALTAALGLMFFARFLTRSRRPRAQAALDFLAEFATPIYLFHQMNLLIVRKLATRILPPGAPWELAVYFGTPALIIAFCIGVSLFLRRYEPKVYALLTGGR